MMSSFLLGGEDEGLCGESVDGSLPMSFIGCLVIPLFLVDENEGLCGRRRIGSLLSVLVGLKGGCLVPKGGRLFWPGLGLVTPGLLIVVPKEFKGVTPGL